MDQITPVLLTYNEAPNIARTLEPLRWAREVVIVDSLSSDDTLRIAAGFPNVRVLQREFDDFAGQWNHALRNATLRSEWVLALDADYVLSSELVDRLRSLEPDPEVSGYRVPIVYHVWGKPLRGSSYPPVTVLFRRAHAVFRQVGHAYKVQVEGKVQDLAAPVLHDDRKPLERWFRSQHEYIRQEARYINGRRWAELNRADRLRMVPLLGPVAMLFYSLFGNRLILDGPAGWFHTAQRVYVELLLSLRLTAGLFRRRSAKP